jgi:hypothetical protein
VNSAAVETQALPHLWQVNPAVAARAYLPAMRSTGLPEDYHTREA